MSWSSPRTWVTGNILTAAQLNTDIRDNELFLYTPPRVLMRNGGFQTIADNTSTIATHNGEDFDTDGMHDNASNTGRATIRTAGVFLFVMTNEWADNTTGRRACESILNGSTRTAFTDFGSPGAVGGQAKFQLVHTRYYAVNDYLEQQVYQNSGGNLDVLCTVGAYWLSN